MIDWLKPLLLMFYAPARGMREVRERVPLGRAALLAFLSYGAYALYNQWPRFAAGPAGWRNALLLSAWSVICVAVVFVPITLLVANLFERRGSFGLVVQQEYATLAAAMFYAWAAASLAALPLVALSRWSGLEAQAFEAVQRGQQLQQEIEATGQQPDPRLLGEMLGVLGTMLLALVLSPVSLFLLWAVLAVREVFGFTWPRAVAVILISSLLVIPVMFVVLGLFSTVFASPFLLLLLFFLLRGYFGEMMRNQRARASFKQNLEAATLNPADASAHYNLGLLHLQRKEVGEARDRFRRAVEIDPEEVGAHYQLGRIARAQNRLADAIKHFEQVVSRDDRHETHEIWREIGATYLAAGQFPDAHDALARFLESRENDPEGLYLNGRALAGLDRPREAAAAMQACIEAVKTAPAYKYRAEKRWLNEAQQFLRTQP